MLKKLSRVLPHFLILACLYGNLNAFLRNCTRFQSSIEGQLSPLPAPDFFFILFDNIGVFKEMATTNSGFFAYGVTESTDVPPDVPNEHLIEIDLYKMLDLPAIEVKHNWAEGGFARRASPEVKNYMANRVQAYHNRKYPDKAVKQVWIFRAWWPSHNYHYKGNFKQAKFSVWAHN